MRAWEQGAHEALTAGARAGSGDGREERAGEERAGRSTAGGGSSDGVGGARHGLQQRARGDGGVHGTGRDRRARCANRVRRASVQARERPGWTWPERGRGGQRAGTTLAT